MDLCTAGDLALYIRKRGDLPSLEASNQGLLPERSSSRELDPKRVLYPHPKEGGLNETIVRCFLDQLGGSHSASLRVFSLGLTPLSVERKSTLCDSSERKT